MSSARDSASASLERKQLTAELQSRSVQLFVTLTSIGDAVITTDGSNAITFLNPVAEKLTGWSLEDAVGMDIESVFRLIDSSSGNPIPSTIQQAIKSVSKVVLPTDAVLLRKDGSQVPIDDSAAPIVDMDGNVLGAVLVFRDITDRKRAELVIKYRSALDRMAARISTAFITSPVSEVDAGINAALKEIGEFLRADCSYVLLCEDECGEMINTYQWCAGDVEPFEWRTSPASAAPLWVNKILSRQHVYAGSIDDIPPEAETERKLWIEKGVKALVAVPMSQEDKVLGFIGVDSTREAKHWPEDIIDLLYVIGNVFASAMGRRDALQKLEAAREQEVEIGSRIQQTLLIGQPPTAFADLQVAALTIPSRKIDGDFYDILLFPDRCMDIIFGDVMGKGVPAALLSAGSKTEFLRSLANLLVSSRRGVVPQPQDIVNSVHSVLTPQLLALDSFVTLSYVRFESARRKLTLVDCGNTRLLKCAGEDGSIEFLSGFDVPLGFSATEVYTQVEFPFATGDLFVLYSDGVTEARNPAGEMFGLRRLCDLVSGLRHMSSQQIVESMRRVIIEFVGTSEFTDDFTCLVVKVVPQIDAGQIPQADEMLLTSSLSELSAVRGFLRDFCGVRQVCRLTGRDLHLLELAMTEVASNIIKHGYHRVPDKPIWLRIEISEDVLRVRFSHRGDPYTGPDYVAPPPRDGSREGGFGLFIINRSVDGVDYGVDSEGRQYVELTKKLEKAGE